MDTQEERRHSSPLVIFVGLFLIAAAVAFAGYWTRNYHDQAYVCLSTNQSAYLLVTETCTAGECMASGIDAMGEERFVSTHPAGFAFANELNNVIAGCVKITEGERQELMPKK